MHERAPPVSIVSAMIGEGASDGGCKFGPAALKAMGFYGCIAEAGRTGNFGATVVADATSARDRLDVVERFSDELATVTCGLVDQQQMPLILGGDHSCAVGSWSGIAQALRKQGDLGLIWIDAHLDAHTPESSDSKAPHGMPLAALLGYGTAGLTSIYGWSGKLQPGNVVVIGARSYEPAEKDLLCRLGVRVMYMPEVQRRGFSSCFEEARALATRSTVAWGISFDLDGLDPQDAPGTGTPVESGIRLEEALAAFGSFNDSRLCAFELAEYNPLKDFGGQTAKAAFRLSAAALSAGKPSLMATGVALDVCTAHEPA